jgi:hydroxyacylglutathione hydrolase
MTPTLPRCFAFGLCLVAVVASGPGLFAQDSRKTDGGRVAGSLDVRWIHGCEDPAKCTDHPIQAHRYEPATVILRQSKAVHFEAPFLYLLFGTKRALLLDTGATASEKKLPLRETVQRLVADRVKETGAKGLDLVVAHSHAHGDHVAGDRQFKDQPSTTVVGTSPKAVAAFFKIEGWPDEIVRYDLGDRVLDVIPIPGHEASSIAIYDERTGLLLTGDTLYPGRLYVDDWPAFRASVSRLAAFAATRPVSHVLGAHVEMTRNPRVDYPMGTRFQPDEHVLQLTPKHLEELRAAVEKMGDTPARETHDDFIIWPR